MSPIKNLVLELDRLWPVEGAEKVLLRIIGSAALMLQAPYERATKDGDILEIASLTPEMKTHLLRVAGKNSGLHKKHRVYLEFVSPGFPFLPRSPRFHAVQELNESMDHFTVEILDVVDVVVSKLARFHADDARDIEAMIDLERIDHARLLERFHSALDGFAGDARATDLPRYIRNFHRVERDWFQVAETSFELPSWIEGDV